MQMNRLKNKFDELGISYHFYDCHAGYNDEDFVLFNTQVLVPLGVPLEMAFIASDKSNWFVINNENLIEDSLNVIMERQKFCKDSLWHDIGKSEYIKIDKSIKESINNNTDEIFVDFVNQKLATFLVQKGFADKSAFGKNLLDIKEKIENKYKNLDEFRKITHYNTKQSYDSDLKELMFASMLYSDNGILLADKNELFKEFFTDNVSDSLGGYMQKPYNKNSIIFDEPLLEEFARKFKDHLNVLGYEVAILKDLRKSDGYDTYCAIVYADDMPNLNKALDYLNIEDNNSRYKLIGIWNNTRETTSIKNNEEAEHKEQNHTRKRR